MACAMTLYTHGMTPKISMRPSAESWRCHDRFFLRSIDGIVCLLAHGPVTTVTCVPTSLYCDLVLRQLNVEGCQSPRRGLGKCCFGSTAVWE